MFADVQEQNIVVLLVVVCHLDFISITCGITGKSSRRHQLKVT